MINEYEPNITLRNNVGELKIDLYGGAIKSFCLLDEKVNPLSFRFTKDQMPPNNKGAAYQGHFLCLGRWGEPSVGEINAGLPNHGEAASIMWEGAATGETTAAMQAICRLEGLSIKRNIQIDDNISVYRVHEHITNIQPIGRLYNMVQHPTIAVPFLDNATVVNCNAGRGYNRAHYQNAWENSTLWPFGREEDSKLINLSGSGHGLSSLYSFVVEKNDPWGWITAYSPTHHLLFGYIWKRCDYPWINLWQHRTNGNTIYRGLEFGTTGLHQPFNHMLNMGLHSLFDEPTFSFVDAGETVSRSYVSFLHKVDHGFRTIRKIAISGNCIFISGINHTQEIVIPTSFDDQLL